MQSVSPQVFIGSSQVEADDVSLAFSKYNVHTHWRVHAADFRYYDIAIGDAAYLYDEAGNEVIVGARAASVNYITGDKIRLSRSVSQTLTGTKLYLKRPKGSPNAVILNGVNTTANSQFITFYTPSQPDDIEQREGAGLPGFLRPKDLAVLNTQVITGTIPVNDQIGVFYYPAVVSLPFDCWVLKADFYSASDFCDVGLVFYDPANELHEITDPTSWGVYAPKTQVSPLLTSVNYLLPTEEEFERTYPSDRATSPIRAGSTLALEVEMLSPSTSDIYYTLTLSKLVQS